MQGGAADPVLRAVLFILEPRTEPQPLEQASESAGVRQAILDLVAFLVSALGGPPAPPLALRRAFEGQKALAGLPSVLHLAVPAPAIEVFFDSNSQNRALPPEITIWRIK